MKRYATAEVDDALGQTDRGSFTPHSQIVLAAEVRALQEDVGAFASDQEHDADYWRLKARDHWDAGQGALQENTQLRERLGRIRELCQDRTFSSAASILDDIESLVEPW